jgi:N-methylhydantoinase B
MSTRGDIVTHTARQEATDQQADVDPITTEVIRHGLNSAAEQMKRALIRTAFSPVVYDVLDFAVAIYDRDVRLLAQAPSLPLFMGTMSFCVEEATAGVGGEDALYPGDIILYNLSYGNGSHAQDAALVMPVFVGDQELVGYTTVKAHWLDIGGKDPYSTDTIDVFQEGTIFPGVKLFSRGQVVDDVYRIIMANSRVPHMVAGDVHAEIVALRTGESAMVRLIERHGLGVFRNSVERMFDHGEAIVRSYFERLPDGRYVGFGQMDNNGIDRELIPFEVAVEVDGSTVRVDYSNSPAEQAGPVNCPYPTTVSATRVAISMLAGAGESPNEGHLRPIEVVTRAGSMFHPLPPAPSFLFGWPALQAMDVIYAALSEAMPDGVPACSGSDLCGAVWWGQRVGTGEDWVGGSAHPVGQGAHARGDGASSLLHVSEAATRFTSSEVRESKYPFFIEKVELATDSGGPGKYRGGLGADLFIALREDAFVTCTVERTQSPPWGLFGGLPGRPNAAAVRTPDGMRHRIGKVTRYKLPRGSTFEIYCGGGGGYGDPSDRDREAVLRDLQEGYISDEHAHEFYPDAFR